MKINSDSLQNKTKELVRRLDTICIVLRGSVAKGIQTKTSDIDIFVVTERSGPEVWYEKENNNIFHLRTVPIEMFKTEIANWNPRYLDFLLNGQPIYDPNDWFSSLQKSIIQDFPSPKAFLGVASEGIHQLTDAIGQLDKDNYIAATYLARLSCQLLIQSRLIMNGIKCFKHKDVFIDISNIENKDKTKWLNKAIEICGLAGADKKSTERIINELQILYKNLENNLRNKYKINSIKPPEEYYSAERMGDS